MGIDGIDDLKPPGNISDMKNYILSRKRKGRTVGEVRQDLINEGYDWHAATAFLMRYWEED
jgi:hypothetical protein